MKVLIDLDLLEELVNVLTDDDRYTNWELIDKIRNLINNVPQSAKSANISETDWK